MTANNFITTKENCIKLTFRFFLNVKAYTIFTPPQRN